MLSQKEIKEILYTSLFELGLKEQEVELYTMSLSLGPTTINNLAEQLHINRPNAYKVIAELEKNGLAKFSERKKYHRTFMVESPTVVRDLLKKKKEGLHANEIQLFNAMPDLLALYRQGELPTSVKIIEGKDQFLKIFFGVLDEAKDEILYFGSAQDLISGFIGWIEEEKWIAKRLEKNLFIKVLIFGGTDAAKLEIDDPKQLRETRLIKNMERFPTSFHIFANKVIIWQPQATLAVLIEDEYIVAMFRGMYYALWEQNKP